MEKAFGTGGDIIPKKCGVLQFCLSIDPQVNSLLGKSYNLAITGFNF